ncbi:phage tail protein, partial [Streptococcus sp. S784/96/1]|uniref:phage tail protein n=1 Tax=Streptococcus sp. S784/96/1 TaxID=2653499 RepID=UPI0013875E59
LKLGYGGTKSEMERLMADAEKLTGEHYTVGDFADTVKAIHAVQQHMDITGTTAKEAATTFSGSLAMMKSSFQNVLGALSSNEIDIGPQLQGLAESTSTFFFGNFIPMVGNIITNLPSALGTFFSAAASQMGPQIQSLFNGLGANIDLSPITSKFQQFFTNLEPLKVGFQTAFGQLPGLFQSLSAAFEPVIETIVGGLARLDFSGFQSLISAILPALQAGFETFMSIVGPAIDNVVNSFVNLWNACQPLITTLSGALMPVFEILASFLGGIVKGALDGLSFAFDALKVAVEFLTPVIDFLVQALNFVSPVLQVIAQWIGQAIGMFGNLGTAGQGLSAFIKSAWTNIQSVIQTAGNIIRTVIDWIKLAFSGAGNAAGVLKNVFSLAWMGIQDAINVAKGIINGAISGIKSAFSSFSSLVSSVGGSVKGVISNITGVIKGLANIDISGAGAAIMNGFLNGLKSAWGAVTDFVGGIAGWIARNKGPISYDKVLLKPAGRAIMGGFNSSLIDGFKEVKSTVGGMAGELATTFDGQSLASDFVANQSVDVSK